VGAQKFVERIRENIETKGTQREQPGMRQIQARAPTAVLRAVARYYGVEEKRLTGKRTRLPDERAVALEMVYRHGGIRQAEIGRLFGGLDYTAVSRERKRLRDKADQDSKIRRALTEIENQMSK
jgi:chromosomal replication initiation ATPase DnaA